MWHIEEVLQVIYSCNLIASSTISFTHRWFSKTLQGYFHFKFIFIQKRQTILRFGLYFRSYAAVYKNTIFRILAFFLWIQSSTVQLARQQEEWESTKCTRSDIGNGHRSINSRDANTNKGTNAIAFLVFYLILVFL